MSFKVTDDKLYAECFNCHTINEVKSAPFRCSKCKALLIFNDAIAIKMHVKLGPPGRVFHRNDGFHPTYAEWLVLPE